MTHEDNFHLRFRHILFSFAFRAAAVCIRQSLDTASNIKMDAIHTDYMYTMRHTTLPAKCKYELCLCSVHKTPRYK